MELPDCPPGAEGYQDSVTEVPRKPSLDETECTKAEQEFQEHVNSLKIKVEDGTTRCMVERGGRDVSGKWIYICYPCAAMCSGETILQTHISGKKHKSKLALRNVWPLSIFTDHPYKQTDKGGNKSEATDKVLQKMAQEVNLHNADSMEMRQKYSKYRNVHCHIQDSLDSIKAPLLGVEYLVEHPPEQAHYEPSYICTLCFKHGHPRTIVNHMTCFWHRYNYLLRHFPKASHLLAPYRGQAKYREGVSLIMNRLAQRIEDKYGRMRPVNIEKEEYEKDKEGIHSWIFKGYHFSEQGGCTFEEVVDVDLIDSLHKTNEKNSVQKATVRNLNKRDPSPPVVAAPSKPRYNTRSTGRPERRGLSIESLSDISDEDTLRGRDDRDATRGKHRFEPYPVKREIRRGSPLRSRYDARNAPEKTVDKTKAPNYEYKVKLADEKRQAAQESANKTLAYHEKNPEKHPLYPEEWKKFWNRRYKEIQAEGKDPSKHDFKPEWIVFWTKRMKELHDEELRVIVHEIYRKLCLTPPDMTQRSPDRKLADARSRSPLPDARRKSPDRRRRSPDARWRSPDPRRRSPVPRGWSPNSRHRSPGSRPKPNIRHRSPMRRRSPENRRSPVRRLHSRSRSPIHRITRDYVAGAGRVQAAEARRSRSPLSRREATLRNRSPHAQTSAAPATAPCMQTVLISDDELKVDGLSPWNSDNSLDSLGSLPEARSPARVRSRTGSLASRVSRVRDGRDGREYAPAAPQDLGPAENVVATLRLLVALEDYLGSLGPKIVDLLTEALKMEKEKANSSEELLVRESAVVLLETAKEKLKGAAQAGLVATAAAAAVRSAVVRVAATLHEADTRAKKRDKVKSAATSGGSISESKSAPMPVAGVGEVDRAQIAQQMAEALIAQGKTDVSSEELAQLVDAVVGMAEAKKREAMTKKIETHVDVAQAPPSAAAAAAASASALQMLQSAYDENDKKIEKEDAPDAMDGLSDSDLETLLKNFNELSAEEQHSLIAYLKKLEAREPQRVERLRQYVSAAATHAPPEEPPAQQQEQDVKPVTIESDDDDYTVEEVFKSATEKVKEDQIRQEMEIVKKSLEESKVATPPKPELPILTPSVNLTKTLSSAADLLALVQASMQSAPVAPPAAIAQAAPPIAIAQVADVVTSNMQPRSFGDRPEPASFSADSARPFAQDAPYDMNPKPMPHMEPPRPPMQHHQPFENQGGSFRPQQNQMNFGGNRNIPNEPFNQNPWEQPPMHDMQNNRGPPMRGQNFGQDGPYNQGPRGNFANGRMQDNYDMRPSDNVNQQFNSYEHNNQSNYGRRGGGRPMRGGGGPMRGRGRGYY